LGAGEKESADADDAASMPVASADKSADKVADKPAKPAAKPEKIAKIDKSAAEKPIEK
jgi:hypothetical protein